MKVIKVRSEVIIRYLEASAFTAKSFDSFDVTIIDLLIQQFVLGLVLPHLNPNDRRVSNGNSQRSRGFGTSKSKMREVLEKIVEGRWKIRLLFFVTKCGDESRNNRKCTDI